MTPAGWVAMGLCWALVIGFSVFLIGKTLRHPHPSPDADDSPSHR